MSTWILLWVLVWTVIAFALMGVDKWRAASGGWRIPEKTLFTAAALGGSLGALVGMNLFRHKTKHRSFTIGLPAILVGQVFLALALTWFLRG